MLFLRKWTNLRIKAKYTGTILGSPVSNITSTWSELHKENIGFATGEPWGWALVSFIRLVMSFNSTLFQNTKKSKIANTKMYYSAFSFVR